METNSAGSSGSTSNMGRHWASARIGERCYPFLVTASVATYWLFASLIPIYNKYFFQKSFYPYPIATAGIQLGIVASLLALMNTVQHFMVRGNGDKLATLDQDGENVLKPKSWIFGPYLLWKMKWSVPIGVLFGSKYAVTNLGLHLVPAPTHLLLQCTDLVWSLLGAWWINGERVTLVGLLCLSGCVAGSVVLSMQLEQTMAAPLLAIAVNLLSPILLGLCVTTLRMACTELMRRDNCVGGTVSAVELISLKLFISAGVAIFMACIFESGGVSSNEEFSRSLSWGMAFITLPRSIQVGLFGGAILIMIFQVNCTFLTFLTSAIAVGLVGQVKIVPQWTAAILFAPNFDFHIRPLNVLGAVLTMTSAGAFALNGWLSGADSSRFDLEVQNQKRGRISQVMENDFECETLLTEAHVGGPVNLEYGSVEMECSRCHAVSKSLSRTSI